MKKFNLLFLITIMLTAFSTITAQLTTVKDGNFSHASTYSTDPNATAVPDSNTSVVINHTVWGGGTCNNLTVNGNIHSGEGFTIYGDLIIHGEFRDNPNHGSDYLLARIHGNIVNYGVYITGTTYFEGSADHYLSTFNDSTISFGSAFSLNPNSSIIIDSLATISGNLLLKGSSLILPGGHSIPDRLILKNALVDGGLIDVNNNTIIGNQGTIGFNGAIGFDPRHTFVKDAVFEGIINFNGQRADSTVYSTTLLGNIVNNGTITTAPHHQGNAAFIKIRGTLTNNSIINNNYSFWTYLDFIESNFVNNGELLNAGISFENNNTFTNNSDSVGVLEIKGLDASSTVQVIGNLIFNSDVNIDMWGGTMILPNNGKLINFGMTNTILEANNSILATRSNSDFRYGLVENAKIEKLSMWYQSKLMGECEIVENGILSITHRDVNIKANIINNGEVSGNNIDSAIVGDITNNGIWKINSKLKGSITNNGTIDNYNFTITGDITNNGSWNNISTLELNGTKDQIISMPSDSLIYAGQVKFQSMMDGTNYQWQRNGEDIENAKSSYYVIYGVGLLPDNATYHCVVDENNSRNIVIQSLTDVEENNDVIPTEYSLSQNYPNPFNPSTVIEFTIPEKTNVSLTVFNSIGEEVAKLVNQEMYAGNHSVNFNANQLSSGIYFYRISAGTSTLRQGSVQAGSATFTQTNKMILLR